MKIKHILSLILVVIMIFCATGPVFGANLHAGASAAAVIGVQEQKSFCSATMDDDFEDDKVIVVLNNITSLNCKTYTTSDFPEISCSDVEDLSSATVERMKTRIADLKAASVQGVSALAVATDHTRDIAMDKYHQILCLTLKETGKEKVLEAVKALEARADVLCAEPSYHISLMNSDINDPYYSEQWGAQTINLPGAWDYSTGGTSFSIGIVDSGIDSSHSDLSGRVDVSHSRDCIEDPAIPVSSVTDPRGHGTHVAGIIGAIGANALGVSGVCWNSNLVSLRVLDEEGDGNTASIQRAINYAASTFTDSISYNDIRILNFSLGASSITGSLDAVATAISNYPGLVVCSAGNDGQDNDMYPHFPSHYTVSFDHVISVGASTNTDQIASLSNYGKTTVDIFAPGESILSCYPYAHCGTNCASSDHFAYGYHKLSGTSMAAPYVTGVAALILADNPTLTAAEIKSIINETAEQIPAFNGKCSSNGRLDAFEALKEAHTHRYNYTTTASTHTGICRCGIQTATQLHKFIVDLSGTYICSICKYFRIGQID